MEDFKSRARMIWATGKLVDSIEEKISSEIEEKLKTFVEEKISDEIEEKLKTFVEEKISDEIEEKFNSVTDVLYRDHWNAFVDYMNEFVDPCPSDSSIPYLIGQAKKSWGIFDGTAAYLSEFLMGKIVKMTKGRLYRVHVYEFQHSMFGSKRMIVFVDKDLFDYMKIAKALEDLNSEEKIPSRNILKWNPREEVYTLDPARRMWLEKARKIYWVGQEEDEIYTCEG